MQKSDYIMKNISFRAEISPDSDSTINSGPETWGFMYFREKMFFFNFVRSVYIHLN